MTAVSFYGLDVYAQDPDRLASFWGAMLGRRAETQGAARVLSLTINADWQLTFVPENTSKRGRNRIHLDLTSTSRTAMKNAITRALDLGGRLIDVVDSAPYSGTVSDDGTAVLFDPDGNEFCLRR